MKDTTTPTRVRFRILVFLFINVVINYMDRSNISIAAPAISKDLALTPIQLGWVFSAFGWTYAALQIPGGFMVDRLKPRLLYVVSLVSWSLVTLLQGLARGFAGLLGLRLATGAFEAPSFPINNRVVTHWFPDRERASAIAVYTSGQYIGLAFLAPVLVTIEYYLSWRGLFIVTGAIGIIWGIIWYYYYRDPLSHPAVNEAELDYIQKGGGLAKEGRSPEKHGEVKNLSELAKENGISIGPGNESREQGAATKTLTRLSARDLAQVFSHRKLWGIYIGQFAVSSTMWFFLTWFPTYLVKYRGVDFLRSGVIGAIPFLAAFAGVLLSGIVSDLLVRKGVATGVARKTPVIIGLILSVSIIGANYVNSTTLIILFMAIAFFGNGFASITWIFVSAMAPKHLIGLTGGVFNFIGNLSSIVVPVVIGYFAHHGNFAPALVFMGALALTGACSYIFVVGKVERIEISRD